MLVLSREERTRLEGLLREPLVAADPLIDVKQAAAVLGITREAVRALVISGILPRRAPAAGHLSGRELLLSDVLNWEATPTRCTPVDASVLLGEAISVVYRLVGAGLLPWHGGRWPLVRADVAQLAVRRGQWLSLADAARVANLSAEKIHGLLADRTLQHTGDVSRPVDRVQLEAALTR
jgi:hypothetical protein